MSIRPSRNFLPDPKIGSLWRNFPPTLVCVFVFVVSSPPEQAATVAPSDDHARWFVEQVHPHDAHLKAYLRSSFPSVRDLDDVVQESYFRVWHRQVSRPIESVKAFLFKVARHIALDELRHERRSPIRPVADLAMLGVAEETPTSAETACTNEEISALLDAIDVLPGRCRDIFILRKLHGVSQKEIARRMGISEKTIEVQIGRGTLRCEQFLRQRGIIQGLDS